MGIELTFLSVTILLGNACFGFGETGFNATEISSKSSFKCPEFFSGKEIFPDYESGCEVYHVCANGHRRSFQCPSDTLFNPNLSACDSSNNTSCHGDAGQEIENVAPLSRTKRSFRHVLSVPKAPVQNALEEFSQDFASFTRKFIRTAIPAISRVLRSFPELRKLWVRVGSRVFPWVGRGARSIKFIYDKVINEFPAIKFGSTDKHYEVRVSQGLIDVYYFIRDVLSVLYFGDDFNKVERSIDTAEFPQMFSRSKRSLNHVLTIPKEPLQTVFEELSNEFVPLASKLMRSSLPGLFNTVLDSSPELQLLWRKFGPKLRPWFSRRSRNLQIVFKKLLNDFPSLKITSNDANYEIHISEGLVNIYHFARDIVSTLYHGDGNRRAKRSTNANVSLNLNGLISTALGKFSQLFFNVLSSDLLSEIFWTETSVGSVQSAFWSGMSAVGPVISEYFRAHNRYFYNSKFPNSKLVSIPKTTVRNAYAQFTHYATPPIKALVVKYLPNLLTKTAGKVPSLIGSFERFMPFFWNNWSVVLDWFLTTSNKYDKIIKSSNSTHYNFVTLSEFKRDMTPGKFLFGRMVMDFWGNEPNSVFPLIFGGNGVLSNILHGLETAEYGLSAIAVPAQVARKVATTTTRTPKTVLTRAPSTTIFTPEPCYTISPITAGKTGCRLMKTSVPRSLNAKQTAVLYKRSQVAVRRG